MAVDFHKQIQNMMTGGGSNASSTTSFVSVIEGLSTDTKKMLELQTKHFGVLEKLLGKGLGGSNKGLLSSLLQNAVGPSIERLILSALGINWAWNKTKSIGSKIFSTIKTGAVNTVKFVADKTFGVMRSAVSWSAARLGTMFKSAFSTAFKSIPSISKIGAAISQYGIKFGTAVKNAFSGFGKVTTAIEGVSKWGNFLKNAGGMFSKFGRMFGFLKKIPWLTGAFAAMDGWSGFSNAEHLTGRKNMGFGDKIYSAFNSATNGMAFGLYDWIAQKQGFRNFNEMADKNNSIWNKFVKGMMGNPIGWSLNSLNLLRSNPDSKPSYINQNGVENLRHRRLSGFAAERRSQNNANIRLGTGVNPYITVDQNSAKSIANQALKNKSVTDAVAPALYSGNSVAMAVVAQMPSSMGDLFSEMRNALVRGATEMVRRYTELQAEAFAEQRADEEEARKDMERKAKSGFLGRLSAFQGILGNNSLLSSIPGMDSSSPSSYPNSTSTNTSNDSSSTTSTPQVKDYANRNADGSWTTVNGKTYAKDSRQAKNWNAMNQIHEMAKNSGMKRPEYKLSDVDLSDEVLNTIASEARMKDPLSRKAVIHNMLNRIGTKWGGVPNNNLLDVVKAPGQYEGNWKGRKATEAEKQLLREEIRLAASGKEEDPTGGANAFRARSYVFGDGRGKTFARLAASQGNKDYGGNIYAYDPSVKPGKYASNNPDFKPTPDRVRQGFKAKDGKVEAGLGSLVNKTTRDKIDPKANHDVSFSDVNGKNIPVPIYYTNQKATRKYPVDDDIQANIQESVYRALGPGYKVEMYSGGQDEKGRRKLKSSRRHTDGGATDVNIYGPDGKMITQEQKARVAQLYLAENKGSIGMEMAQGGIHFDRFKRGLKYGVDKDALNPNGIKPEAQSWFYNNGRKYSKATRDAIAKGLKGILPEGVMSREDFLAQTTGNKSTPTASVDSKPKDRYGESLESFDKLINKATVSKPTQNFVRPDLSAWPEQEKNKTLPDQVKANKNGAQDLIKKTEVDKKADTTQDTKVRVADVPPIDEYKVVMFNGSSFV